MTTTSQIQPVNSDRRLLQNLLRQGLGVVKDLWSYTTDDWVTSVHAGDIDGDGDFEVVLGSRDGSVRVLTRKGELKWQEVEKDDEWIGSIYSVDNVKALDSTRVVFGMRNGQVVGLTEIGERRWPRPYRAGQVIRRLRVADIDQDGKAEVLVGSEDFCIHVLSCETGELLWKYSTNGWIRSVFPIDVDGDGETEVLVASGDKNIYILDHRGNLKKKHWTGSKIHALYAADLDQDGVVEILVGSDAKDLYAMTPDGKIKWRYKPENRIHSINAVDLNKDGYYEIVAGSEDEHIYILDHQGNLLWKHFLGQRIFSLYTVDLNRDGIDEILAGAEDNNVWALAVELQGGLLARIKETHASLGSPHSSTLNLSATEQALLHDLVDEPKLSERQITTMNIEKALALEDHLSALAALLYLKHQHMQMLWMDSKLGHVRFVTLDKSLSGPERELLVGTDEGDVILFTSKGEKLWSCSIEERIRSLDIGDVDGDGEAEVLIGSANGYAYALSSTKPEVKFRSHRFSDNWIESIAIIHPQSTGIYEVVLGTRQSKEIQIAGKNFDLISQPFPIPQSAQSLCVYDINGDGVDEILVGLLDDGVHAYTREGDLLWIYQTKDRVKAISVCDIDNDGEAEVLVGSESRHIHVLDCMGKLRWRYYTQHRVLALGALDVNQDGEIEIFVGAGNGLLYVLNSRGDLLWRFQANDRIRAVVVEDINGDGFTEIVIGTEDRLYVLQHLDQKRLDTAIEQHWQALLAQQPLEQVLHQMMHHQDSYLRAFVLNRLAAGVVPLDLALVQTLHDDNSVEVRRAFTEIAPLLSRNDQAVIRPILDTLAADRRREIRLALVDCFAAICQHNPQLGFEYLERLTRSTDLWVRHAVVRQLDQILVSHPKRAFTLLMNIIMGDKELWVRQESARVLARYLDIHSVDLLRAVRLLIVEDLDTSLLKLVMYGVRNPTVRDVFQAFLRLLEDLSGENVLNRLEQVVAALAGVPRQFEYGEIMAQMHQEFCDLHSIRTIDEMAQYACDIRDWSLSAVSEQAEETTYFSRTLQVLQQLNTITGALRIYLRREGLGERISSLLEAEQAIEKLTIEMRTTFYKGCQELFPDYAVLRLLMLRWRGIVHTELSLLRGRAELVPELGAHQMAMEETIVVPLLVQNTGSSSAENVTVVLLSQVDEKSFTLVGSHQQYFATISASNPAHAEFTLKPHATSLRLAFEITYDDAEGRSKTRPFGFRLDLVVRKSKVTRLPNPYYTGIAMQKLDMFYGREKEIELLQEDFVYSQAPAVVVLYGQRRSGKSSLIYKLFQTNLLDPHIPVRIDMQHETLGFSIEQFFRNLAYAIHCAIQKRGYSLPFPDRSVFKDDAVFAFERFLDDAQEWLERRKLVLLIDEFEVLNDEAESQQIDKHLFDYLRSLVQERQCLHLLLAGTHTLEELTSEYWSIFFNLANHRRLANLTPEAARQLICDPMKEYLEYDPFAVEKIRSLTGDQPYLIQLFCHSLVRHCQASTKDYVTINDVNVVLEEVKQSGRQYFNWIWEQASREERIILAIIAQASGDGEQLVSFNDVERIFREYRLSYTRESLVASLRNLRNSDVIVDEPDEQRYKITVGLTRSWLHEGKPIQRVILGQE